MSASASVVATSAAAAAAVSEQNDLQSSDQVRDWLQQNYRKQLILLDKFLHELRLGRLKNSHHQHLHHTSAAGGAAVDTESSSQSHTTDRLIVTRQTLELLRHILGSTKWKTAAQALNLLRGLGRDLHASTGGTEPAIDNVVRRVMAAVREEALSITTTTTTTSQQQQSPEKVGSGARLSLESMLWALPQHVKSKGGSLSSVAAGGQHVRTESFSVTGGGATGGAGEEKEWESSSSYTTSQYPASYYSHRPDLKQAVMEAIQEIMTDLEDLHRNINEQAISSHMIHADEVILTYGKSKTIELFLKAAAAKQQSQKSSASSASSNKGKQQQSQSNQHSFTVIVCDDSPHLHGGPSMAQALANTPGMDVVLIQDAAIFAIMARVNKVLLPAHAVLANGGLISNSGSNLVALAAKHNKVPVVCVTGLFKLCPMYPHEGQDTLNELLSPSAVLGGNGNDSSDDFGCYDDPVFHDDTVELVNPVHDYIKPEHVSLYLTNVGSFQPSFIYRLLAEYYHMDDWESFE